MKSIRVIMDIEYWIGTSSHHCVVGHYFRRRSSHVELLGHSVQELGRIRDGSSYGRWMLVPIRRAPNWSGGRSRE